MTKGATGGGGADLNEIYMGIVCFRLIVGFEFRPFGVLTSYFSNTKHNLRGIMGSHLAFNGIHIIIVMILEHLINKILF